MNETRRLPSSQKISSQLRYLLRSAWHKNSLQYENTMGSNPPILWGAKKWCSSQQPAFFKSSILLSKERPTWVVLIWFDVCWCYIVVWLWRCGICMQAKALVPHPAYGYHTTTAKPQCNTNTHRTRAIQPMK